MTPDSSYRLDLRLVLRTVGLRLLIAALGVVVAVLLLATSSKVAAIVGYVVAAAAIAMVAFAGWTLWRPPVVVTLTDEGYRIHGVPGSGATRGRWLEVSRVDDQAGAAGPMLVIEQQEARTTFPLGLVAHRSIELQREVRERLNRAHGYRGLV